MKDLILFGMQGSGKGTQGKLLAEKYGYQIFETGAELRKLTEENSELGRKVKDIVQRGDLVPNEIVMEIGDHFLNNTDLSRPVLFDGIPRSLPQKATLDALLEKHERKILGIFLEVDEEEATKRLLLRARSDDNEAAIRRRIENYRKETLPVIEKYESAGILFRTNGLQEVTTVFSEVSEIIEEEGG
ncbi:nucleoside monophosphate kinase [Candidatus Peregrinibacteria bacterium]|nr:nucleoside monophosphate kinase [Candidatus Peregrinibacteria bacterium]